MLIGRICLRPSTILTTTLSGCSPCCGGPVRPRRTCDPALVLKRSCSHKGPQVHQEQGRQTLQVSSAFWYRQLAAPPDVRVAHSSILGEHFHSHWDVKASELKPETGHLAVYHAHEPDSTSKDKSSTVAAHDGEEASITPSHRVVYLTEQTSHHPPISHFYYECRPTDGDGKGNVIATGADQLSARFTGTTIKVFPGEHNKGIFVRLPKREEEYQVRHTLCGPAP